MIQRNYKIAVEITDDTVKTLERYKIFLQSIKESEEYKNAKSAFINIIFAQIPKALAEWCVHVMERELPKAKIVGMSRTMFSLAKNDFSLNLNCLFFDEARTDVVSFVGCPCKYGEEGQRIGKKIAAMKNVKGVLVMCAGVTLSLSEFLDGVSEGNEDIPFFGAMAGIFQRQSLNLDMCDNIFSRDAAKPSCQNNLVETVSAVSKKAMELLPTITGSEIDTAKIGETFKTNEVFFVDNGMASGREMQYVVGQGELHEVGIVMAIFSGENLRIMTDCIFGWQPLGKEMVARSTSCKTGVATIDGIPATDIYKKYLNVTADKNFLENICEFPLVIDRDGFDIARVPPIYDEKGAIYFNGDVKDGERVRLTYGNPVEIISNTRAHSEAMRRFSPQSVLCVICGNRDFFLGEKAREERLAFLRFAPEIAEINGSAEIYRYKGHGGILNSMFVAVGMREGDKIVVKLGEDLPVDEKDEDAIPLSTRLASFLNVTTSELKESNIELTAMAESAKAASRAKSQFLSSMSHEIRTPINAILGMDEMILRECKDETILEYARNIQTATANLLGLVNDILDFSKIEAGKMTIVPVEYAISSVLNDLVNMINKRAAKKGLQFIVEAEETMPSILYGDEIRIKQVVTNILTNAVKYTEHGSVTLSVDYVKKDAGTIMLKFAVKDTGIGIKQEDMDKLFSAFTRIEEKRNRSIEGTGLGMNITQRLLTLMNSRLNVSSVYGEGSTFSFAVEQKVRNWDQMGDFEEAYRRMMEGKTEYHEKFTAPKARILVVDDTTMNLTVVRGLLKQTLVKIDTAESGYECLHMVQKNKYDIIFLDHRMPGMDGIETLRHMKKLPHQLNEGTPVISLTANAVSGAREEYMSAGFDDYLTKPINSVQLELLMLKYLPEEKVTRHLEESAKDEEKKVEEKLPEWLEKAKGLDVAAGLKHCGGAEAYMDALTVFAESVASGAEEIERYYEKEMWHDYTVKVHALKSTSRVIGAGELSEKARRLEDAGNNGYIDEIKRHTGELLSLYRSYEKILSPLGKKSEEADDSEKPLIDAEELADAYETMRDMAANFDYDNMMFVFESLDEYRLPDSDADLLQKIKKAATQPDWDKVRELLSA